MRSYSQTHVFSETAIAAFEKATDFVRRVPDRIEGVRCHELARAVHELLQKLLVGRAGFTSATVIDGFYGISDHSWIELVMHRSVFILDVYAVGRLPQVQLIDTHMDLAQMYRQGDPGIDIREDIVKQLLKETIV